MWNARYATQAYVYGTAPNDFLKENAGILQSPVLTLAEGEGRNAVYLAALGLDVLGVDASDVGLAKAQQLAASRNVNIHTQVADLATYEPPANTFNAVVSIFAHVPSGVRQTLYPRIDRALKPGGIFLLEAYTPAQLARNTGGPKDADMLITLAELKPAFSDYAFIRAQEIERNVTEGTLHTGMASVVQFIARKK